MWRASKRLRRSANIAHPNSLLIVEFENDHVVRHGHDAHHGRVHATQRLQIQRLIRRAVN